MAAYHKAVFLFLVIVALSGAISSQWGPSSPDSGVTQLACVGLDANFTWDYVTGADETMIDILYLFIREGQPEVALASFVHGNFLVDPQAVQHVTFLPPSGLRIIGVTSQDAGVYVIKVNVVVHGQVVSHSRNVTLQVAELPVLTHGHLDAQVLDEVVYDNSTRQWHAVIACGQFTDPGHPPVHTIITTPDNRTVIGHYDNSGLFVALLPNPVSSGQYSCQLDPALAACVPPHSPLLTPATVIVDGTKTQLAIATTELEKVKSEQCKVEREALSKCTRSCLCPSGSWLMVESSTCYKVYGEVAANWTIARDACVSRGGRLAVLDTRNKTDSFMAWLKSGNATSVPYRQNTYFFIGGLRPYSEWFLPWPNNTPDEIWLSGVAVDWAYYKSKGYTQDFEPNQPDQETVIAMVAFQDVSHWFIVNHYPIASLSYICEFAIF